MEFIHCGIFIQSPLRHLHTVAVTAASSYRLHVGRRGRPSPARDVGRHRTSAVTHLHTVGRVESPARAPSAGTSTVDCRPSIVAGDVGRRGRPSPARDVGRHRFAGDEPAGSSRRLVRDCAPSAGTSTVDCRRRRRPSRTRGRPSPARDVGRHRFAEALCV